MSAYETFPWSSYEPDTGRTCSAEVRMGTDGDDLEAEVQVMFDEEPADGSPLMKQICHIWMTKKSEDEWGVDALMINEVVPEKQVYNWEEKCCSFFKAVTVQLAMDRIPDMDDLLKKEMHDRDGSGGNNSRGQGGSKAPKVKADQFLGNKKGGF